MLRSDLSGCSLSSLHCTLHVAAPLGGRLRAREVQAANRLPQHPTHGRGQEMRGPSKEADCRTLLAVSPAKLCHDSWGEIGCVAAPRVLLLTPVLFLIVYWLAGT